MGHFLDYILLPALGVAMILAPLVWLWKLKRTADGKYPFTYYDEVTNEKKTGGNTKRKLTSMVGFKWYIVIQLVAAAMGIAILVQYKGSL